MNNLPCACDSDYATIFGFFIGILVMNVFFTFRLSFSPTVYMLPYKNIQESLLNLENKGSNEIPKDFGPSSCPDTKTEKLSNTFVKVAEKARFSNMPKGSVSSEPINLMSSKNGNKYISYDELNEARKLSEKSREKVALSEVPEKPYSQLWHEEPKFTPHLISSKNGNKYMSNVDMTERNVEYTKLKNSSKDLTDDEIEKIANL